MEIRGVTVLLDNVENMAIGYKMVGRLFKSHLHVVSDS